MYATLRYNRGDNPYVAAQKFIDTWELDQNFLEQIADFIEQVAAQAIEGLPAELRARLHNLTITLEPRPSMRVVSQGFDPRAFGLFDAPVLIEHALPEEEPTQIVLYTSNLLTAAADPEALARQVEITMLHEIAHYFGFEEDDMDRLGLR